MSSLCCFSCDNFFPGCQLAEMVENDEGFVATIKTKFLSIKMLV